MEWIDDCAKCLDNGLYPHSLIRIRECCERGLKAQGPDRLAAYVIRSITAELLRDWDDRALQVDETHHAEKELVPALRSVLGALREGAPPATVAERLDLLVQVWAAL